MKIKVQDAQPGQIYDGREILLVDADRPHVALEFTRETGGGRHVFWWDQYIWVQAQQLVDAGEIRKLFGVLGEE